MDENVRVYDFKKPQRYSSDNMRFLSVVSEEFCKNINIFLAYELKKPKIHCKIEKVEQTNYDEFINIIDKDSFVNNFFHFFIDSYLTSNDTVFT